ncbi:hypothetical protein Ciccas_008088 [Cichlidogyrus casuarinus]|uniref:Uncharacterized protein n=1 Tax=Cichlidogyrus casuarinus TaxID=1844966 RepID=A0ABD2Q0Y7_9PLAT
MSSVFDLKKPHRTRPIFLKKSVLDQIRILFIWINLLCCLMAFVAFGFCLQMSVNTSGFVEHTIQTDINLTALENGRFTKGDKVVPGATACICVITLVGCLYIAILMVVFAQPRETLIASIFLYSFVLTFCCVTFLLFGPLMKSQVRMYSLESVYLRMFRNNFKHFQNITYEWGSFNAYWLKMQQKYQCCGVTGSKDFLAGTIRAMNSEIKGARRDTDRTIIDELKMTEEHYQNGSFKLHSSCCTHSNDSGVDPLTPITPSQYTCYLKNLSIARPPCGPKFAARDQGLNSFYVIQLSVIFLFAFILLVISAFMFKCFIEQELKNEKKKTDKLEKDAKGTTVQHTVKIPATLIYT